MKLAECLKIPSVKTMASSLSNGPTFSKVGHSNICARTNATNRLLGQNKIFHNGETLVRNTSMRSPVHTTGSFVPTGGLSSPSLKDDEVWAIDTGPIARGSEVDIYPSSFESPYCVEPNGGSGATGDGKPGRRNIDSEVLAQKQRSKFGGSFDKEKKYTQYVSLLDETTTVNSTGSPFEAPRKAGFVQYRISDLSLPGPGTYSPHLYRDVLKLPTGASENGADSTMTKARKAKLGIPKHEWESPTPYEPPREMKEGKLGGCGDRWSIGSSSGELCREMSFPLGSVTTGRFINEAYPPAHLVAAGWDNQSTFNFKTKGKIKAKDMKSKTGRRFNDLSKAGTGGMGGLAHRNTHKSSAGDGTVITSNVPFIPLEKISGCFSGPDLLRRTNSRFVPENSPLGGEHSHSFSSENCRSHPPRHHHLALCHQNVKLEGYEKLNSLELKLKLKKADEIWGKDARNIDIRTHMNKYKFGEQERFKVKAIEEPLLVDKDETAMYHFDSKKHENLEHITDDPASLKELKMIAKTKSKAELTEFKTLLKHRKSVDNALKKLLLKEKNEEENRLKAKKLPKSNSDDTGNDSNEYNRSDNEYGVEDEEYDTYDQENTDSFNLAGSTSAVVSLNPPPPSLPPVLSVTSTQDNTV